ncbi:MAG: VOC family protein [Bacteroidota bacterium]
MNVNQILLELMVVDVDQTIDFYEQVLGFELLLSEQENGSTYWAKMRKGAFTLTFKEEGRLKNELVFLKNQPVGGSVAICLLVDDLEGYHQMVKDTCDMLDHPHITPCGSTQFSMLDNNGYILTFERFQSKNPNVAH